MVSCFKRNHNKAIIHVLTMFFFVKNTKTGKKGENRKQQQNVYRKNCFCKQLSQEFSLQANVISFCFFLEKSNKELL